METQTVLQITTKDVVSFHIDSGPHQGEWTATMDICPDPNCPCMVVNLDFASAPYKIKVDLGNDEVADESDPIPCPFVDEIRAKLKIEDLRLLREHFWIAKDASLHNLNLSEVPYLFDFEGIEEESALVPFNDVFPSQRIFQWEHDGQSYVAYDLYCVRPECSCTTVGLHIYREDDKRWDELCFVDIDIDKLTYAEPVQLEHRAITDGIFQIPSIKPTLQTRRGILRQLYAVRRDAFEENMLDDFASIRPMRNTEPKIGRNEPCPCGSGKKYKKCCMRNR